MEKFEFKFLVNIFINITNSESIFRESVKLSIQYLTPERIENLFNITFEMIESMSPSLIKSKNIKFFNAAKFKNNLSEKLYCVIRFFGYGYYICYIFPEICDQTKIRLLIDELRSDCIELHIRVPSREEVIQIMEKFELKLLVSIFTNLTDSGYVIEESVKLSMQCLTPEEIENLFNITFEMVESMSPSLTKSKNIKFFNAAKRKNDLTKKMYSIIGFFGCGYYFCYIFPEICEQTNIRLVTDELKSDCIERDIRIPSLEEIIQKYEVMKIQQESDLSKTRSTNKLRFDCSKRDIRVPSLEEIIQRYGAMETQQQIADEQSNLSEPQETLEALQKDLAKLRALGS
jgi:tetrahydromethanopterin S-methyltransferase subunit B